MGATQNHETIIESPTEIQSSEADTPKQQYKSSLDFQLPANTFYQTSLPTQTQTNIAAQTDDNISLNSSPLEFCITRGKKIESNNSNPSSKYTLTMPTTNQKFAHLCHLNHRAVETEKIIRKINLELEGSFLSANVLYVADNLKSQ